MFDAVLRGLYKAPVPPYMMQAQQQLPTGPRMNPAVAKAAGAAPNDPCPCRATKITPQGLRRTKFKHCCGKI